MEKKKLAKEKYGAVFKVHAHDSYLNMPQTEKEAK